MHWVPRLGASTGTKSAPLPTWQRGVPYTQPMCTLPSPVNVTIHLEQNISKLLQSIYVSLKLLGILKLLGMNLPFQITSNLCYFRALWSYIYCMTIAIFPALTVLSLPFAPSHNLDLVNLFVFRSADSLPLLRFMLKDNCWLISSGGFKVHIK